jgi:hypothetical protein
MRTLRFDFHPERIRVTPQEILDDLRYPAASPPAAPKAARKQRDRRLYRR